jgi:arabinogalactan endo-1,4-beta-galactosidase
MKKIIIISSALVLSLSMSCQKDSAVKKRTISESNVVVAAKPLTADASSTFAYGSDVSWVTQMESSSLSFYNGSGTKQDLFTILKGLGINAIRLRAWVNPSDGWCNTADLVAKAKRAVAAGMSVMIDFHYSDSWADPGKQYKPVAWASESTSDLYTSAYNYTISTLNSLKSAGVTPTWVQVGNETNDGMMWQDGRISAGNALQFTYMVNTGYNAVKLVFPNAKVIVHIANGYSNSTFRYIFDILKANGAKYDVIGMSLYPSTSNWSTYNSECLSNMNDMVSRYGKQVMICEAGMSESAASTCESFLSDLINKVKSVSGGNGLGVFYWEPEAYNNWQGYTMGAFDPSGKPTVAMNAFAH